MTTATLTRSSSRLGRALLAASAALRRDTERLAAAVGALGPGDCARAASLARWLGTLDELLEQHHALLDDVLLPALAAGGAERGARARLAADHAALGVTVERVRRGLEALARGDREGAHGLLVAAADLRDGLADHLDEEERLVLPALEQVAADEIRASLGDALRHRLRRGPGHLLPWLLDGLPARERDELLALTPAACRVRLRLQGTRRYARLSAALS